jgi:hypothetical protein
MAVKGSRAALATSEDRFALAIRKPKEEDYLPPFFGTIASLSPCQHELVIDRIAEVFTFKHPSGRKPPLSTLAAKARAALKAAPPPDPRLPSEGCHTPNCTAPTLIWDFENAVDILEDLDDDDGASSS